ncbi:MAG: hypothetical protein KME59_00455 [Trichormus sp. ATA11-4-KO1]|nr:hypothetical protein [Trichormus sp. ATA11-4-KO1]
MLTEAEGNVSKSIAREGKTPQQQIQSARQLLLGTPNPELLRIVSYLRICCSVMEIDYLQALTEKGDKLRETPYFISLLKSLFEYDPEWWQNCKVSADGDLKSDDPIIAEILQPLEAICQK